MPTDDEYLAKAGLAETGEPLSSGSDTASTQTETAPTAQAPEAKTPSEFYEAGEYRLPGNTEVKLTHDGKIVKTPISTLANTYRQFSHLQEKHKTFNEERTKFEQQKTQYEAALNFQKKYGPLQEWSEKNPKDWDVLWNLYQNKDKHLLEAQLQPSGLQAAQVGAGQNNSQLKPVIDEITSMKKALSELTQVKTQFEQKAQAEREQRDTEFVQTEMNTFQKDYPEINLQERDPDGVTLWAKVMKFGVDNGYRDFEGAALKFLKSRLQDTWASRARNEAVKGLKTDRQQGIMQRSAQPIQGQSQSKPFDPRKMSYAEIAEAAKNGSFATSA